MYINYELRDLRYKEQKSICNGVIQILWKMNTLNQNVYFEHGQKVVIVMIISILENEFIGFELWNDFIVGYDSGESISVICFSLERRENR